MSRAVHTAVGWVIASLLVLTTAGCDQRDPSPPAAAPLSVVAVKAVTRDVPDMRTYPGTTQSPNSVTVTARVRGVLEARYFEEGDEVTEGRKLYLIQPEQYDAKLAQAEADVAIARANVEFAQKEYDRNEPLTGTGAISAQEWDRYARTLADALSRLAIAEANLVEAGLNRSYCDVTAPIAGRIGATRIDVGNLVGPGTDGGERLAQIFTLDPMRVTFQPGADEYAEYERARQAGKTPVRVLIRREGRPPLSLDGQVDLLDNTAQPSTSTFLARAQFPSPDRLVLPNQFADVRVQLGTIKGALLVPGDAIFSDQTTLFVYVVKSDDTLERRDVETGKQYEGFTQITKGVAAGDTVVVSASPLILKGVQKVKPTLVDAQAFVQGKAGKSTDPQAPPQDGAAAR